MLQNKTVPACIFLSISLEFVSHLGKRFLFDISPLYSFLPTPRVRGSRPLFQKSVIFLFSESQSLGRDGGGRAGILVQMWRKWTKIGYLQRQVTLVFLFSRPPEGRGLVVTKNQLENLSYPLPWGRGGGGIDKSFIAGFLLTKSGRTHHLIINASSTHHQRARSFPVALHAISKEVDIDTSHVSSVPEKPQISEISSFLFPDGISSTFQEVFHRHFILNWGV